MFVLAVLATVPLCLGKKNRRVVVSCYEHMGAADHHMQCCTQGREFPRNADQMLRLHLFLRKADAVPTIVPPRPHRTHTDGPSTARPCPRRPPRPWAAFPRRLGCEIQGGSRLLNDSLQKSTKM